MRVQRLSDPLQQRQRRNRPASFESRQRGLRHTGGVRKRGLGPPTFFTHLPHRRSQLEGAPRSVIRLLGARLGHTLPPNLLPTPPTTHVIPPLPSTHYVPRECTAGRLSAPARPPVSPEFATCGTP